MRAARGVAVLRDRLVALVARDAVTPDCGATLRATLEAMAARIEAVRTGDTRPPGTTSTTIAAPGTTVPATSTSTTTVPGHLCGNGVLDRLEQCDGTNLFGRTCLTLGFPGGELKCGPDCIFDVSGCASY